MKVGGVRQLDLAGTPGYVLPLFGGLGWGRRGACFGAENKLIQKHEERTAEAA